MYMWCQLSNVFDKSWNIHWFVRLFFVSFDFIIFSLAGNTYCINPRQRIRYILECVRWSTQGTRAVPDGSSVLERVLLTFFCHWCCLSQCTQAFEERVTYTFFAPPAVARYLSVPGNALKNAFNWRSYDALLARPLHAAENTTPNG
jgi:hypothetical protein